MMEKYFTLRGRETTRLDTFIDAAFAFATTMLVISIGNIPKNINELLIAFKGIPSFSASFVSVIFIWLGHRKWSRRYGIENGFTIAISFSLVFVLMIYIYPLRLVFSAFFSWISAGYFPSEFAIERGEELPKLFIFYGIGFGAITLCMSALFYYAFKQRDKIDLKPIEIIITKYEIASWLTLSLTALLSALFAFTMPLKIAVFSGFVYFILPIAMTTISMNFGKRIEKEARKEEEGHAT
jgi:uncharacterized membrane protein